MKYYLNAIMLLSLSLIAGCSSPGMLTTATGRPEITVPGRSLQEVSNALAEWSITHGFDITKTTFFSMAGERVADSSSALHNINIGTRQRVVFDYATTTKGIHVSGDFRSGTEELGNIEERDWLQNQLREIADSLSH